MPRVSVVIPSFNHEKYIEECIQSVLDQTFQDFEIIVVDDHSTDATLEKLEGFKDERIRLFRSQENRGQFCALERGINAARGEFIAVLNSDDAYFPEKLAKQIEYFEKAPSVGAIFTDVQLIDEDGSEFKDESHHLYHMFKTENRSRFEWLNHFFFKEACVSHPSLMVRRECHQVLGHYKKHLAQWSDLDFILRLLSRYEMHVLPEKLTKFRIRLGEANTSGNRPESRIRGNWEFGRILRFYLTIPTLEDFIQIFPNAREKFGEDLSERLIPFYVAMLALDHENILYKHFAISTLFDLFDDAELAEEIVRRTGFTHHQLSKLATTEPFCAALEANNRLLEQLAQLSKLRLLLRRFFPSAARKLLKKAAGRLLDR